MRHTKTIVALFIVSAVVVFAIGLPWLLKKHQPPAEYVANEVATTKEIQEFDLMWTELEALQRKSAELGPDQYKQQFLESTTTYLQFDSDQTEKFVRVVEESLQRLNEARTRLTKSRAQSAEPGIEAGNSQQVSWSGESPASIAARRDVWSQWLNDQRETSDLLLNALQPGPRHMAINQDLKALTPAECIDVSYLPWLLRGSTDATFGRIDEAAHGTKVLRMEAWTSIQLPVPPIDEQLEIVATVEKQLEKLSQLQAEAERAIELLQERRTAIISAAVTGKIDVREFALQETA